MDDNSRTMEKRQKLYNATLSSKNSYVLAASIIDEIYDRPGMKLHLSATQLDELFYVLVKESFYNDYANMETQFSAVALIYVHSIHNHWRETILSLVMETNILNNFAEICSTCQQFHANYFIENYRKPFNKVDFYATLPNDYQLGIYI